MHDIVDMVESTYVYGYGFGYDKDENFLNSGYKVAAIFPCEGGGHQDVGTSIGMC